jgi:ribosomal-protein-alanine N-acetyltransferase
VIPPADDVDRIMAVMQVAFDPAHGEAWTRAQLEGALLGSDCHYIMINESGFGANDREPTEGPIAGFALLRTVMDEQELLLFAIHPDHRRRGLGTRLLATVEQQARENAISRLLLEMRKGNHAERLYRTQGFTPLGIRPNYYRSANGGRIDAITFGKTLDS